MRKKKEGYFGIMFVLILLVIISGIGASYDFGAELQPEDSVIEEETLSECGCNLDNPVPELEGVPKILENNCRPGICEEGNCVVEFDYGEDYPKLREERNCYRT